VSAGITTLRLPRPAQRTVLAFGAYLKNTLCLLAGDEAHLSPVHGDLGTPEACAALRASAEELVTRAARAGSSIAAVAHDRHPDFDSTRVALGWAERLGVPALAVQHHHAHLAVVQAELGTHADVLGFALDGVGLGTDGLAWGGELLATEGTGFTRLGHLPVLGLPGGDVAAREPWRMASALLFALGEASATGTLLGAAVGEGPIKLVGALLERGFNTPLTTSAGRWFDAVAGLLGVSVRQSAEAEAAIALERLAESYLSQQRPPALAATGMDLTPVARALFALRVACEPGYAARGAALFHVALAEGLAEAGAQAAEERGVRELVGGGGCFFNRVLTRELERALAARGLTLRLPRLVNPGDAGLALGQAWLCAEAAARGELPTHVSEASSCV
jgi:hydrogenase maturation protein HypF